MEDKTIEELVKTIQEYKSILGELYEDYDEYGDPHEEIPMFEQLLKEAQEEQNKYYRENEYTEDEYDE